MALVVPSNRAPIEPLPFMRRANTSDGDIGNAFDERPLNLDSKGMIAGVAARLSDKSIHDNYAFAATTYVNFAYIVVVSRQSKLAVLTRYWGGY